MMRPPTSKNGLRACLYIIFDYIYTIYDVLDGINIHTHIYAFKHVQPLRPRL